MTFTMLNLVWRLKKNDLSVAEVLVMLCLADMTNDDGICWPRVSTISERTGMAGSSVYRTIALLKERGLLITENCRKGGRQAANNYRLLIPTACGNSDSENGRRSDSENGRRSDSENGRHNNIILQNEPKEVPLVPAVAAVRPSKGMRARATGGSGGGTRRGEGDVQRIVENYLERLQAEQPEFYASSKGRVTDVDLAALGRFIQAGHDHADAADAIAGAFITPTVNGKLSVRLRSIFASVENAERLAALAAGQRAVEENRREQAARPSALAVRAIAAVRKLAQNTDADPNVLLATLRRQHGPEAEWSPMLAGRIEQHAVYDGELYLAKP